MLTCPDCKSVNPQFNNFCQGCGRSLKHHICPSCGNGVEFDAENCGQCHALSGTYRWAIIEQMEQKVDQPTVLPEIIVENNELGGLLIGVGASASVVSAEDVSLLEDAWANPPLLPVGWDESLNLDLLMDLAHSPWDDETSSPVSLSVQTLADSAATVESSEVFAEPLATTIYLDDQCRYRLLDPIVIQLLTPNDSSGVQVIDRKPFCNSPLEMLMEQEPVTLDHTTVARLPEEYRQWQLWNDRGVPKVAQAYIALQVSLPGTIPPIHDGWNNDGKTVTILEDRTDWMKLADSWSDPGVPPSQIIYWLDFTLKLWVSLEPWQMRQSLLELGNLLLDEDGIVCLQQLYPEPTNRKLKLTDLALLWQSLFDRASTKYPALDSLLHAMETGEVERVEEVRSRLQQIAYELEPKQLSAPLESPEPTTSSSQLEAPTMVMAQKLVNLEEAAATHVGRKRDHNEDCFGIVTRIDRKSDPKGDTIAARGLYILCDGMGGHAGGEIASAMTVDLLRDYFAIHWGDNMPDEEVIREGIVVTNEAVFEVNQKNSASGSGRMGTTLVLVLVQDRNIAIAHVGDSRCYGITPTQGLIQLTLDHEVGQQQILRGVDPEIAYGRPDSYQLTQAIGPRDRNYIAPEIRFFELQEDTLLLIASDGLTDNQLLENHWLTNVAPLLTAGSNLQHGVDRLIDFANEYNGHDNITALVVRAKIG